MAKNGLFLKNLGINTYKEAVIYMRQDCRICKSEGLEVYARVKVDLRGRSIIATLNTINSDLLHDHEASLSRYAWNFLGAQEGDEIRVSHAKPVESLSFVRSKIYGHELSATELKQIVDDIVAGKYSDIQISSFLTACAGGKMKKQEIVSLAKAMVEVGDNLRWNSEIVVDKHCVGGLPANRTTPIIVAIVAAFGLVMPKTSSRAITSPAGTADMMEVLTVVDLDVATIKKVIAQENGCIVWGGSVALSPADDILIRVEKALDLDSEGQLIASVLSKKIAAGSTHILIDMPVGETAKVRSQETALLLKYYFEFVAKSFGIIVKVIFSDGSQPVGRGIGPALEARDVVAVLKCEKNAPQDLRQRAIFLAAQIIEFSPEIQAGDGIKIASEILDSGQAWQKFQAICQAQGGMKEIPQARYVHPYQAKSSGQVLAIDNRRLSLIAKLAGAPNEKTAGVDLRIVLGQEVKVGDELFVIHAESQGDLFYALDYLEEGGVEVIRLG